MRGRTLNEVQTKLKSEIGYGLTSSSTAQDVEMYGLITNQQDWFCDQYDWSFFEHHWDLAVAIGDHFVTVPTVDDSAQTTNPVYINFERPVRAEVLIGNQWIDLDYGIGALEYNQYSTADPIRRWRMDDTIQSDRSAKIEIWPIPVTATTIRFWGQRKPAALATSWIVAPPTFTTTAIVELDDLLLIYSIAAEKLTKLKSPDAPLKMKKAEQRFNNLRANYPKRSRTVVFGEGYDDNLLSKKKFVPFLT